MKRLYGLFPGGGGGGVKLGVQGCSKINETLAYHFPGSLSMSLIHSAVKTSRLWKVGLLKLLNEQVNKQRKQML